MKKYQIHFLIFFVLSFFSTVASARTFYLNATTMTTSFYNTGAFELSLFFWNPTNSDQNIDLTNLRFSVFSINAAGNVLYQTENRPILSQVMNYQSSAEPIPAKIAIRTDSIYLSIPPAPGAFASSTFTIEKKSQRHVVYDLNPNAVVLGNSILATSSSTINTTSFYMAYVNVSGRIIITDAAKNSKSGFIFASGSILRPVVEQGKSSAQSYEFKINNGNPL